MLRIAPAALTAIAAALALAPAAAAQVKAGAASIDATYNVGTSSGQYSSTRAEGWGEYDPHLQSIKNQPSYGVQSREDARAVVIKGADGRYAALVTNDHYIPQDSLWRRTAQIASELTGGALDETNITMAVSHNHSSPSHSSLNPGVWAFQDVVDLRFFHFMARRNAEALKAAFENLHAVRVSATSSYFDRTQRNPLGPGRADDGSPAGFTNSYVDHDLSVVRFENIDDPEDPQPLATIVNLAQHPEFLEGYDLISAEFPGAVRRLVDRAAGGITLFTQGSTGNGEIERETYHPIEDRANFDHTQYAQMEWAARLIADGVLDNIADIDAQTPNHDTRRRFGMAAHAERFVPWASDFPVAVEDRWFPGPVSHLLPSANNCRTDTLLSGNPRVGTLADCTEIPIADTLGLPIPPLSVEQLQELGIPVPDTIPTPSFGLLEPTLGVHMQAIRLGEILFTVCSCEQWTDQSHNIKTRLDKIPANEWLGWDPTDPPSAADDPRAATNSCTPNGDGTYKDDGTGTGTWTCSTNPTVKQSDHAIQKMRAQILNDAAGWDEPTCTEMGCGIQAEAEPNALDEIRGNYTHDDTTVRGGTAQTQGYADKHGYDMVIAMSMANDYNGYIATYRDYQTRDHYRKALTGWGPHSSDFYATRLVRMGHTLKGDADAQRLIDRETDPVVALQEGPEYAAGATLQLALQRVEDLKIAAVGEVAELGVAAYELTIPDDGGEPAAVIQPKSIERFDAATFTWIGGNNYTDNPVVVVERRDESGGWERFADQSGEVPVTLDYPGGDPTSLLTYRLGGQEWRWTATFEAFVSRFGLVDPQGRAYEATPAGTYRFVVRGEQRKGGAAVPYTVTSQEFEVAPWDGITIEDVRLDDDRHITFSAGPRTTLKERRVRKTNTRDFGELEFVIGPVDFPDTAADQAATGAKFLNSTRGYSTVALPGTDSPDLARAQHYCLDCRFRDWQDATNRLTATVTFTRPSGETEEEKVRARPDGTFRTDRALGESQTATIVIHDDWGNFSPTPATVEG